MLVFYVELGIVYILALYSRLISNKYKLLGGFTVILIITVLSLVAGFRNGSIGDTEMYKHLYDLIGTSYVSNGGYEPGFILFFKILKRISYNPQFMLMVTSFATNILIIWTMSRFPGYFELETYLYITSGYYLVTMNGLRQSIVAAILFACTHLIIKGRFKSYLFMVLLMLTFHNSALVMIPIYFIVRTEAWSPRIYKVILIFVIGLIFYEPVMNIIFGAIENSRYADYKNFNEGGANILRVLIVAVPVILAYIKRKELREKWPESRIFVNMALLDLIIMSFSAYNWIIARFSIYTQLYSFILLGYILKYCSKREERKFIYLGLIVAYFIYFWYDQSVTMNIQYKANFKW